MPSGTVKFFNPSKGFGFITPEDGSADIFVHISAVERSGLRSLNDGDQVRFQVEEDRRSGKVNATDLEVTGSGPAPSRAGERPQGGALRGGYDPRDSYDPRGSFDRRNQSDRRESFGGTSVIAGRGTVKWFNTQKGFGFIAPEAGGDDVFVHISAVERAGLRDLHEGQVLTFDVEQSRNGKPAAVNLRQVG